MKVDIIGGEIIVDPCDSILLSEGVWRVINSGYASLTVYKEWTPGEGKKLRTFLLHRLIMGLERGDRRQVDHVNKNKLDNRRSNLRIVSRQQNQFNRSARKGNAVGVKGVSFDKRRGTFVARIKVDGKCIHLGEFKNKHDAGKRYDEEAFSRFGSFAKLNFPVESD